MGRSEATAISRRSSCASSSCNTVSSHQSAQAVAPHRTSPRSHQRVQSESLASAPLPPGPPTRNKKKNTSVTQDTKLMEIARLTDTYEKSMGDSYPKAEVYQDYLKFCKELGVVATTAPAFGKVMRMAFPDIQCRRKGPRGEAKHHYRNFARKKKPTSGGGGGTSALVASPLPPALVRAQSPSPSSLPTSSLIRYDEERFPQVLQQQHFIAQPPVRQQTFQPQYPGASPPAGRPSADDHRDDRERLRSSRSGASTPGGADASLVPTFPPEIKAPTPMYLGRKRPWEPSVEQAGSPAPMYSRKEARLEPPAQPVPTYPIESLQHYPHQQQTSPLQADDTRSARLERRSSLHAILNTELSPRKSPPPFAGPTASSPPSASVSAGAGAGVYLPPIEQPGGGRPTLPDWYVAGKERDVVLERRAGLSPVERQRDRGGVAAPEEEREWEREKGRQRGQVLPRLEEALASVMELDKPELLRTLQLVIHELREKEKEVALLNRKIEELTRLIAPESTVPSSLLHPRSQEHTPTPSYAPTPSPHNHRNRDDGGDAMDIDRHHRGGGGRMMGERVAEVAEESAREHEWEVLKMHLLQRAKEEGHHTASSLLINDMHSHAARRHSDGGDLSPYDRRGSESISAQKRLEWGREDPRELRRSEGETGMRILSTSNPLHHSHPSPSYPQHHAISHAQSPASQHHLSPAHREVPFGIVPAPPLEQRSSDSDSEEREQEDYASSERRQMRSISRSAPAAEILRTSIVGGRGGGGSPRDEHGHFEVGAGSRSGSRPASPTAPTTRMIFSPPLSVRGSLPGNSQFVAAAAAAPFEEEEEELEDEEELSAVAQLALSSAHRGLHHSGPASGMGVPSLPGGRPLRKRDAIPLVLRWIRSTYEQTEPHDPPSDVPKEEVYENYKRFCASLNIQHTNSATFGKLLRSVFPSLKTRRLGSRGNTKHHYNGIRVIRDPAMPLNFGDGRYPTATRSSSSSPTIGSPPQPNFRASSVSPRLSHNSSSSSPSSSNSSSPSSPSSPRSPAPGSPTRQLSLPTLPPIMTDVPRAGAASPNVFIPVPQRPTPTPTSPPPVHQHLPSPRASPLPHAVTRVASPPSPSSCPASSLETQAVASTSLPM